MDDDLHSKILARQTQLELTRRPVEENPVASWSDIIELLMPGITPLRTDDLEGQDLGLESYTGYPAWALRVCANGMQGHLINRAFEWFTYASSDPKLREDSEVRGKYQECRDQIAFDLSESNFYDKLPLLFRCALSVGNISIITEEDWQEGWTLDFTVPHPREAYWAKGRHGYIDVYHRKFKLTVYEAAKTFGKENLPNVLQKKLEKSNTAFTKHEFIHAIYPWDDPILQGQEGLPRRPWISVYILVDKKQKTPIRLAGYWDNPVAVWLWEPGEDEVYGRGIGSFAIYDVKQYNQIVRSNTLADQIAVEPPMLIPMRLKRNIRLNAGGRTYIQSNEDIDRVREIYQQRLSSLPGRDREDRVKEIIDYWFCIKEFLMLSNLEKALSPLELAEMLGEKAVILASGIGQLESTMDRLMERVFHLEYRAGRLPELPEPTFRPDGTPTSPKVQYRGPLDQALRMLFKGRKLTQALGQLIPIWNIWPEAKYKLRPERITEDVLEDQDIDQDSIVPDDEYYEIVAKQAQKQEVQQQLANLATLAQIAATQGKS